MTKNLKIAALTMLRGDLFYLRKWVEYYGAQLGLGNLYIFFDGLDQSIPDFCKGTRAELHPRMQAPVAKSDKLRIDFLSSVAARLFNEEGYDLVIGTDVDEFLVVDPKLGLGLAEYLSGAGIRTCLSGLGLDFGQKLGEETEISADIPFLSQRHYAQLGTRYTKASVLARPLHWGSGFHRVEGTDFHIGKDLYLMHFGYFDLHMLEERFAARDSKGWAGHLKKRSRTIRYVTSLKARDFDKWTAIARRCQTIVRPPYAWNKPAMFEARIVVRIPDRFSAVL